jgi:hypothetical protein
MTPSGINPATLRFVAQCLNYCTTASPLFIQYKPNNINQQRAPVLTNTFIFYDVFYMFRTRGIFCRKTGVVLFV